MTLNLVCFPHYTCGGLLTTILNDELGTVVNNQIHSFRHHAGKQKLDSKCDNESVFKEYDAKAYLNAISKFANFGWLSTHRWPGLLILQDEFAIIDQVLNITTVSAQSQLLREYRVRALTPSINDYTKHQVILNPSYAIPAEPVYHEKVINLEFSDVVFYTEKFTNVIDLLAPNRKITLETHLNRWKKINYFLYD